MPNEFNASIIDEFRANKGQLSGPFADARLLLLTTTGARSGRPHTVPLRYTPHTGDRVVVVASAAGAPRHPAWYHNVLANPTVTVESGGFTYEARAEVLAGDERDEVFARIAEHDARWADYQAATARVIPVVTLARLPSPPRIDGASFGTVLSAIHDTFRRELRLIRAEVAASGASVGAQLRVNCLALCGGLTQHHTMEDGGMFVGIGNQRPDLAPVLARLREEHEAIAALVEGLDRVLADAGPDRATLLAEVDRLTAELESHLTYEERSLIPVLDGAAP